MQLTLKLFFFKLPRGHLFRGKNRLVKKVTKHAIETLKKDYEREEMNMLYLRHPYLTVEQSKGHSKALKKQEILLNKLKIAANIKFSQHRKLEDELAHLKVKENWEFEAGSRI